MWVNTSLCNGQNIVDTLHELTLPQRSSRNMQVRWRHRQLPCVRVYQGTCPVISYIKRSKCLIGRKFTLGYGQYKKDTCVSGQSVSGEAFLVGSSAG